MADSSGNTVSAMLYQGVGMLVICVIFLIVWLAGCRKQQRRMLENMHTPLLSLCGEKLAGDNADDATKKKKENASSDGATPTSGTQQLTTQQIRARKRKEWVRKLDVNGNMFWYRGCVNGGAVESQFPGYAVRFQQEKQEDDSAEQQQSQHQVETVAAAGLVKWDDSITMDLVPSNDANPAIFPTGSTLESKERMNEVVTFVAQDFPTKYAHFVISTASLIVPAEVEFLKLSVHREYMLEESIDHLSCIQEKNIRSFMRITFLDESGVDAGGVHREWFMLVNEMLLSPQLQLFVCHNKSDQSFYLNPSSAHDIGDDHLTYYFSTGRLIGRALLEGGVWGFHLSMPLVKIILGIPVSFSDLEYFDPEAYKSMQWLLDNEGVETLGLDFSVTEKRGADVVTVDLIPDGRNIPVTDANKHQYLERKFHYTLFESVSRSAYDL
ncbi:Hect ubiquitin ligase, partial [Globisporangium splendens]